MPLLEDADTGNEATGDQPSLRQFPYEKAESNGFSALNGARACGTSEDFASLQTEQKNKNTTNIDAVPTLELCRIMNEQDAQVATAVQKCLPQITAAIDTIVPRLATGGQVIYTEAGTSGRLGVLDASEILFSPPTFSAPHGQFVSIIAGGDYAIRNAVEGAEDSEAMAAMDLSNLTPPLGNDDVLIGIASSGRTPYVLGSLKYARSVGAAKVGVACVQPSALQGHGDVLIECVTGPEVVTGSTRLKAGTATKMTLNMISTGSQIRSGKTYGNLMVDVKMSNEKLQNRARRVVRMVVPATSALDITRDDVFDEVLEQCIDVAHCRISSLSSSSDIKVEVLGYTEIPVKAELRSQVLRLCRPNRDDAATSMAEVCDLNFTLGREFSRAVKESGFDLKNVDIVASHGQTLWHQPFGENKSTLQMAEPAVIARETGRTVVGGFRVAELAAGRQGAPLAGFFESALLSDPKLTRVSQNIGGIGNASVLPASASLTRDHESAYFAFDTGPGNVFIDAAMRILTDGAKHYDHNGELGASGELDIDHKFVENYLEAEPYFQLKPPKTTGRELFSDDVARKLIQDMRNANKSDAAIIATITRITAESIATAYEDFVIPHLERGRLMRSISVVVALTTPTSSNI
ncbi:N-acetylmuramic acid 6-phosphate etherase [Paramyrothecium foliicola]|nr:N-acetylmuramic acid 6-phosphate etherase [Paramyrothecium foliicola]